MAKIGFIGMGNMGYSMLKGVLKVFDKDDILFTRKNDVFGRKLAEETGLHYVESNAELANNVKYLILAVKPQVYDQVIKNIENVKLLQVPAAQLVELIPHHSISKIFLNFSDPWPKSGYKKRRLVHPFHLQIFEQLLKKDGQIAFKTDNLMLFEFGLESFKERNYEIVKAMLKKKMNIEDIIELTKE